MTEKVKNPIGRPRKPTTEEYRIWIRLSKELEKPLTESCKKNNRSQSAEINFILKDYYTKNLLLF